jgi:hypothetical protein
VDVFGGPAALVESFLRHPDLTARVQRVASGHDPTHRVTRRGDDATAEPGRGRDRIAPTVGLSRFCVRDELKNGRRPVDGVPLCRRCSSYTRIEQEVITDVASESIVAGKDLRLARPGRCWPSGRVAGPRHRMVRAPPESSRSYLKGGTGGTGLLPEDARAVRGHAPRPGQGDRRRP